MVGYNATSASLSADIISASNLGWVVTIGIFLGTFVTIFLLSRNVRQFIYGSIISVILIINYKFSRYVGVSTSAGNFGPVKMTLYVFVFIIVSIIIGRLLLKLKFVQDLEKKIK